jgi:hypothetical protein
LQIEVELAPTTYHAGVITPDSAIPQEGRQALNAERECAKVVVINQNQRRLQKQ